MRYAKAQLLAEKEVKTLKEKRLYQSPEVTVASLPDVIATSNPDVDPGGWVFGTSNAPEIKE